MSIVRVSRDGFRFVEYGKGMPRYYDRNKPELSQYFQGVNQPIAVIGSGPTVIDEAARLPSDCLYYAVNWHFLGKGLFNFTYLSFLDRPTMGCNAQKKIELYGSFDGVRITNQMDYADVYCVEEDPLICGDTGIFALWVALYLTTEKVYVCGMDNRTGETMHSEHSHIYKQTLDWDITQKRPWFRWDRLMNEGYKSERLTVFNKTIKGYLRSKNYRFNEH